MKNETKPTQEPVELQETRTPYAPPTLVIHGTIQELTEALANPGGDNVLGFPAGSTM
jgi:hypothetical protein